MAITDRYNSAVRSSNLKTQPATTGDTDVLGAMGLADRDLTRGHDSAGNPVHPAPLAVPLQRLFAGDNRVTPEIVQILATMAFEQSWVLHIKINRTTAEDMAKACLAWHRDGVCKPCGGHGETLIPGTKTHSGHACQVCRGTGKMPLESQFRQAQQPLVRWMIVEMERASGQAGPRAMRLLADKMNLD